jgi:hypothetical protein
MPKLVAALRRKISAFNGPTRHNEKTKKIIIRRRGRRIKREVGKKGRKKEKGIKK